MQLAHAGLGGIAATDKYVVFGDRDGDDFHDVFRCLDAKSGKPIWEIQRLAIAELDYGNTPRSTPLIHGDLVYCQGAHGHLLCIRLSDGEIVWEKNYRDDFPTDVELPWGYCGSPLLVEGQLIVAPGAADASLVSLDAKSGNVRWKSPGIGPSYGSLNVALLGGVKQIVGHDAKTIGGWDVQTGKRLWTIEPLVDGDFNVPTPIIYQGDMIIVTENNGTRRFRFEDDGQAIKEPVTENEKLRSDMSTPVVVGNRLFCVKDFLYCLDIDDDLSEQWRLRDRSLGDYASIIASDDRLLVVGKGELLLFGTDGSKKVLARQRIYPEKVNHYSHPALVGNRLYIRGQTKIKCFQL